MDRKMDLSVKNQASEKYTRMTLYEKVKVIQEINRRQKIRLSKKW